MKDHEQLQHDLAKSGYIVPDDRFAEDPNAKQPSTETKSGDGGKAAADIDQTQSAHTFQGKLLSQDERANKAKPGAPENKAAAGTAAGTASEAGLDDVAFASAAARTAAEEAGLVAADFNGVDPSSENGYTKADVQQVADAK